MPARYPTSSTPRAAKVMPNVSISPRSVNVASKRHAAAVSPEAATTAGTRNHSPSSNPIAPTAERAHQMAFSPF